MEHVDNLKTINDALKKYKTINPYDLMKVFPRAYQSVPEYCIDASGVIDVEKWGKETFKANLNCPEHLKHMTNGGNMVRAKSKIIIANALYAKGIEYKYEMPLMVGGYELHLDFQLISKRDMELKILEHIGMLYDEEYLKNLFFKFD